MATPPAQDVVSQVQEQMQRYITHSSHDPVTLHDVMMYLRDVDDDRTVDLVLYTCLQTRPQNCACLAAVRYERVEMLLRSAPSLVPELGNFFWREALKYLVDKNHWPSIQALLARGTGKVCWNLLGEKAAASFEEHPAAVAVFDMLAAGCLESECSCVGENVILGLVDRFKTLVNSQNIIVRRFVLDNIDKLPMTIGVNRQHPETHPGSDWNGCLAVACEAGLFTTRITDQDIAPDTGMGWAVYVNQPDLVRFLYHAGATNNRHLFQLSRDPDLHAKVTVDPDNVPQWPRTNEDYPTFTEKDAAQNIQRFLSRVASTPRSLETLCLLQVSGHLGWGHGRKTKIEQLNIPPVLTRALEFKDLKTFLKYPSEK